MDSLYTDLKDLPFEEIDDAYKRIEEHGREVGRLNENMRLLAQSGYIILRSTFLTGSPIHWRIITF